MRMQLYMYAYTHACMHTCMYACVCVCIYACMRAYVHACMHACMRACVHACMHACAHLIYTTFDLPLVLSNRLTIMFGTSSAGVSRKYVHHRLRICRSLPVLAM